jgi:hypothetical protein
MLWETEIHRLRPISRRQLSQVNLALDCLSRVRVRPTRSSRQIRRAARPPRFHSAVKGATSAYISASLSARKVSFANALRSSGVMDASPVGPARVYADMGGWSPTKIGGPNSVDVLVGLIQ